MSNKTRTAALAATALFTLALLPGAVMDLVQPEMVTDVAENLSMPLHILTLVGIWKWLGIIALWQPVSDRVREWAFAGFLFDLTGASWWHANAGDAAGIAPPLVVLAIGVTAYTLRRKAGLGFA